MIGPNDFVPVLRARTQGEALLVKDLLEHEGIRVVIPGLMLTDDIGAPRQLLNLEGVEVQVPAAKLEEAQAIIAEAREAGRALAEDTVPDAKA